VPGSRQSELVHVRAFQGGSCVDCWGLFRGCWGLVRILSAGLDLEQLERSLVVQALERTGWNQTKAAVLLGLNRDQIRYRIEKFWLERADPVLRK
jgi:transcriptional regulator of acetoin/glycerol metabolism